MDKTRSRLPPHHKPPPPRAPAPGAYPITAPVAPQRPHTAIWHGETLTDPWAWLKDPGYPVVADPDILAYVEAENACFEAGMAPLRPLIDTIYAELKARIVEDDSSVPARDGAYEYWWQFAPGGQYRSWYRRPAEPPAAGVEDPRPHSNFVIKTDDGAAGPRPQMGSGVFDPSRRRLSTLILDEPTLAAGHDYFRLGDLSVSPNGKLIAYAIDTSGDERFVLKIRDLETGEDIATVTDKSVGSPVWTSDSTALAWTEVNENWRRFRIRLHRLGQPDDNILYEETADIGFGVSVGRSQDRRWLVINTGDHATSEVRLIPADNPSAPSLLVRPRQPGVSYDVDTRGDTLFIRANDTHPNFRLATAPLASPGDWADLIPASDRDYITGFTAFASYLMIAARRDGLEQIRLRTYNGDETIVPFAEASYTVSPGTNAEPDAPLLRLGYSSMVTPQTVFDYQVATNTLVPKKVQQVPSGYDPGLYATERLTITARDGTKIPVSLVHRKDRPRGHLHVYGYGAYGIAIPPSFSTSRLSLLDRGLAYAIAHIRGGDDMGYGWYLDGKLEKRTNTFTDFVDVARGLAALGWGPLSASGGSAGGELMGVIANTDPTLWRAIVADVPFVDVLNTMLDDQLPLTPGEWPEWGNPITDPAAFALIKSYSPYDNVTAQDYPAMLVTAGLNDPRVTYWEPAKWVAKLRAHKTDANPLYLRTNMGAGHGGKSGRFAALEETAEEYAFLLAQHGLNDAPAS